jgi:hypothetical protein
MIGLLNRYRVLNYNLDNVVNILYYLLYSYWIYDKGSIISQYNL